MSRRSLLVLTGSLVAALTLAALWATTRQVGTLLARDSRQRVERAGRMVEQGARLEMLQLLRESEFLAADPQVLSVLRAPNATERVRAQEAAFTKYLAAIPSGQPDILAILDASGSIVAMHGVNQPVASEWRASGDKPAEMMFPALTWALGERTGVAEVVSYPGRGLMRMGVASVVDVEVASGGNPGSAPVVGVVVVAKALTSQDARGRAGMVGANVAYADEAKTYAHSFVRNGAEDTARPQGLSSQLAGLGAQPKAVRLGGEVYDAVSTPFPRYASRPFPTSYPSTTAFVLSLAAPHEQQAVLTSAQSLVALLGLGALILALVGMHLTSRHFLAQIDQLEIGVSDLINGNTEQSFPKVGDELDGLANGLNVMVARLLGRPDPEDDAGTSAAFAPVALESPRSGPTASAELAALADELEDVYLKRTFAEYTAARRSIGSPDPTAYDAFVTKLRSNEAKLRAELKCRAVRFRVVVKDGRVTLKPVPIYA